MPVNELASAMIKILLLPIKYNCSKSNLKRKGGLKAQRKACITKSTTRPSSSKLLRIPAPIPSINLIKKFECGFLIVLVVTTLVYSIDPRNARCYLAKDFIARALHMVA